MKSKLLTHHDIAGKDFMYHAAPHHIVRVENDGLKIITNRQIFTFADKEQREYFLAELLPIDNESNLPAVHKQSLQIVTDDKSNDLFIQILTGLKSDFDKISTDASHIPAAAARLKTAAMINNTVRTKLQLEAFNRKTS